MGIVSNKLYYGKICKNITTFGNILIKHTVKINSYNKNNGSLSKYKSTYAPKNMSAVYLRDFYFKESADCIILENNIFNTNTKGKRRPFISLSYNDVTDVIRILDNANNWFIDPKICNDMYKYDLYNNPIDINENKKLVSITKLYSSNDDFMSIQPTIIVDMNEAGISYPGIVIKGKLGIIGTCTLSEFQNMRILLKYLLLNLYSVSLNLLNNANIKIELEGEDKT